MRIYVKAQTGNFGSQRIKTQTYFLHFEDLKSVCVCVCVCVCMYAMIIGLYLSYFIIML